MSDAGEHTHVLGEAGEACGECGAPLAIDQRYCLNCGRRRGAPRVDFREHLPRDGAVNGNGGNPAPLSVTPAPSTATQAPSAEKPGRDYAPLAAVGGIAILGLMLLVGVLIGKGDGGSATAPPPQVVRLGDEGAGATASEEGSGGKAGTAKKAKGSGKAAKNAGSLAGAKGGGAPVEASDEALQELQEQSPEEYQESSAKLPDEIATGGAPPPEDNKAPGGGSKGTAIE
jgi:hypothetical protein